MGDLHLTLLPNLYLGSLILLAGCHSQDARLTAVDISVSAILEQPGNESEQVVHVVFHRDGELAKRSLNIGVFLEADAQAPVELVSVGELVPETERDAFENAHRIDAEYGMIGQVSLAQCPGGVACTSVFSCVVTSNSPAPGEISLLLLGGFTVDDARDGPFGVELRIAP